MGNCISYNKIKYKANYKNKYFIYCDKDGVIFYVSNDFLLITGYKIYELENKFIGIIMSPFLSFIYSNIILKEFNKLD